jgi:hypothetical protein
MASPLIALLSHFWTLGEASGNRTNSLGAASNPFVPSGTITKITGQIPGTQADQFGPTYGDALSAPGATTISFSADFTVGMFIRMPNPNPATVAVFGRGTWYERFDFDLYFGSGSLSAFLGDGRTSPASGPFAAPLSPGAYGNGTIPHSTWTWVGVRHVASTKTLTFFLGDAQNGGPLKSVTRTYTGTIVDSTLPLRINGLDFNAAPLHAGFAVQGVFYAPTTLTDRNIIALYNLGQGLLPPFTAYASEDAIPNLQTTKRYAYNQNFTASNVCQQFAANGQDTSLSPALQVQHVTTGLQFGFINSVTSYTQGESIDPAKHATITIQVSYFVEGDTVATPLTFNGASSVTLAYGESTYADSIDRYIFPNQNIRVLTYYVTAGSVAFIPGALQYTSGGRRGTGTNTISDITIGNYTVDSGQYGFGPSVAKGYFVANSITNNQVAIRGDSIASGQNTYVGKLAVASGVPHLFLAVAGSRSYTVAVPDNDLANTTLCKESPVALDQFGVNDLNLTNRTFAQLVADKTTCWTRWFGAGSVTQKLICVTLTPMQQFGNPPEVAARLLNRGLWNTFLRSGGTNADFGAMTGRPTLVYRWNGTAFVSSGARSGGTGLPLDVYIVDTASVTENNFTANDNVWSTSTAGGTKVDCSVTAAGDGIHPTATEAEGIKALLLPQYNTALSAELPPSIAPSGTATLAISYVAGVLRLTRGGTITGTGISYRLERIVAGVATTLTPTMGATYDDTGYTGPSGQSYRVTPYNAVGEGGSALATSEGSLIIIKNNSETEGFDTMYSDIVDIVPHDTNLVVVDVSRQRGIIANSTGVIKVSTPGGNTRTINITVAGVLGAVPVQITKVLATGTTATGIQILVD